MECFATEFLGNKTQISLTEVIDRGPFALWGLSLELPRLSSHSSWPCVQILWLQGVQAALPSCCEDLLNQVVALLNQADWAARPPAPAVPSEEGARATVE